MKHILKKVSAVAFAVALIGTTSPLFNSGIDNIDSNGIIINAEASCHYCCKKLIVDGTLFKSDLVEAYISGKDYDWTFKIYINHQYITTLYHVSSFSFGDIISWS